MSRTGPTGGAEQLACSEIAIALEKWLCGSMKPGTSVLPARSTTFVSAPRCAITASRDPTARILPSRTATASATGWRRFTVTMSPPA